MIETPVGDRHVLEALGTGGYSLGGEQSGHVIFPDQATTGDGLLRTLKRNQAESQWFYTLVDSDRDRVLALDCMALNGMLLMLVLGLHYGSKNYFEAALLLAVLSFVGAMAMAKFLLRGEVIE